MATIAVIGTLDTKGREHQFVADCISQSGHQAYLIDIGTGGDPQVIPYMSREAVVSMGGLSPDVLRKDREQAGAAMGEAAARVLLKLIEQRKIHGVISLGGGSGTATATAAMRALPLGFPKVMVSTLAGGDTSNLVGTKDIVMIPSIVDIAGLNRISRPILASAAGAICGMIGSASIPPAQSDRPLILASLFSGTSQAVLHAKTLLEKSGFEVVVFHANSSGSITMDSILESGVAAGLLDMTATDWADEVVAGTPGSGPKRLEAAARSGTPSVIVPGGADMARIDPRQPVPDRFRSRNLHPHSPQVTLLRTNVEENAEIGRRIAEKVNLSTAPVSVLLPLHGLSQSAGPGTPFHDADADRALLQSLRGSLNPRIHVTEFEGGINDPIFAESCAHALLSNIRDKAARGA
jgi:uncharacterized protein (UPF0261 family)